MDPIITIPEVPAPGSPPAVWVFFALGLIVAAAPLIIRLIQVTGWGKRNRAALGEIVAAIDLAKRYAPKDANTVTTAIKHREKLAPPAVVETWKRAVARVEGIR